MKKSSSSTAQLSKVRFVTAASLFDGHDVAINIMRRILQASGAEVIHLGHNRSVDEIVTAAIQEDAQGIAISSYQGGHVEYFKYTIDLLRQRDAAHIKVFGGGGGVITPEEKHELEAYGVTRLYTPGDGQQLGLQGIIDDMLASAQTDTYKPLAETLDFKNQQHLAQLITASHEATLPTKHQTQIDTLLAKQTLSPVLGITGTGGAGKSSLTDELLQRFLLDQPDIKLAIIAIDPSKRKTGGALLGDRIRMNAIHQPSIYMRSLASRPDQSNIFERLPHVLQMVQAFDFDLIIVETPGIGQGDASIVPHVDKALYVMTPEFGASSQLEKIDMLDYADLVAINKFDRKGALDALHDVAKQMQRSQVAFDKPLDAMPVYGTNAAQFNDDGITALYLGILESLRELPNHKALTWQSRLPVPTQRHSTQAASLIPSTRHYYLAEIAATVRTYHEQTEQQSTLARHCQHLRSSLSLLDATDRSTSNTTSSTVLTALLNEHSAALSRESDTLLAEWPALKSRYKQTTYSYTVRDKTITVEQATTSLAGTIIPKVALPNYHDDGDVLAWLRSENVPGSFPFTAGVFPFRRQGEDPSRMFAGEGDAFRTNKRFKLLSEHAPASRLSTAFDSVTLYGFDPNKRPDIYGKVGNSGVSIATLDDMKVLYSGFDLCAPNTSVSMTINGPAPTILAMFLNTAIAQQLEQHQAEHGAPADSARAAVIKEQVLQTVRGTVQADILKEDQAQNTCIFSTAFGLKMMADIQEYFVDHKIKNFYSVSVSGYHIAEAGANPITQLAFTLANGFTLLEIYLNRGLAIDDFANNFSFFFSNGMDPEYSVMGRVARRIWAVALREKYGANARSQKLKYHVQTSGRSLHAQEMAFNDIRTTLEALIAIYDNCNSLHTNAYDEAVTTPTEESVRRAQAIQLIINKEWGLNVNENSLQGSFIIEELTDLIEVAVLAEFERLNERGGVLGAMETSYQRTKIQEESMYYEMKKNDGSLPIIGVNSFVNPNEAENETSTVELARSTQDEKDGQLTRLQAFQTQHAAETPAMLDRLRQAVIDDENIFAVLMDAVQVCSLGQITDCLFEVGGKYRRNM